MAPEILLDMTSAVFVIVLKILAGLGARDARVRIYSRGITRGTCFRRIKTAPRRDFVYYYIK